MVDAAVRSGKHLPWLLYGAASLLHFPHNAEYLSDASPHVGDEPIDLVRGCSCGTVLRSSDSPRGASA
jgi:hypothetical protein